MPLYVNDWPVNELSVPIATQNVLVAHDTEAIWTFEPASSGWGALHDVPLNTVAPALVAEIVSTPAQNVDDVHDTLRSAPLPWPTAAGVVHVEPLKIE